jgi:hypothetical protein
MRASTSEISTLGDRAAVLVPSEPFRIGRPRRAAQVGFDVQALRLGTQRLHGRQLALAMGACSAGGLHPALEIGAGQGGALQSRLKTGQVADSVRSQMRLALEAVDRHLLLLCLVNFPVRHLMLQRTALPLHARERDSCRLEAAVKLALERLQR